MGSAPSTLRKIVGDLHGPVQVIALGPDRRVGRAIVVERRVAGGHRLLRGREVVGVRLIRPAPNLVGKLEVHLEVRVETRVGDPVDRVAVLDQVGELGDIVVGRGPGTLIHMSVLVALANAIMYSQASPGWPGPEVCDAALGNLTLRPVERHQLAAGVVGRDIVVRLVDVEVPHRGERRDIVHHRRGKHLRRVGGVPRLDQFDVADPGPAGTSWD